MVVFDAEMLPKVTAEFMPELAQLAPHARLVIIPTKEDPSDPRLQQLGADAILSSPFYLPDLLAAVENFFGPLVSITEKRRIYGDEGPHIQQPPKEPGNAPEWLQNVSEAARYLTRLSLETDARAALIVRGDQAWAYAGDLSKGAADELADAVADHAANGTGADLARFVHLNATKSDYMLYGTSLGGDFMLALAFDAQVPFSQMRAQVSEIAKALTRAPQEVLQRNENQLTAEAESSLRPRLESGPSSPAPDRKPEPGKAEPVEQQAPVASPSPKGGVAELRYGLALVPRLPKHQLQGDLAQKIAEWLPELCISFGWRLESMDVQLESLQWLVAVSPDVPAKNVVKTLDKYLSERIFKEFPRLAYENPSGHFWASDSLLVNEVTASAEQLADFVKQTRVKQGLRIEFAGILFVAKTAGYQPFFVSLFGAFQVSRLNRVKSFGCPLPCT